MKKLTSLSLAASLLMVATYLGGTAQAASSTEYGAQDETVSAAPVDKVEVPKLEGKRLAPARALARRLGFKVKVVWEESNEPEKTVLGQTPRPGALRPLGATIRITVAKSDGGDDDSSGGGGDGNYLPAIPPGSDVDCAGGSGNGPRYEGQGDVPWGPFQVIGSDIYGLDGYDNDGWGCED